MNELNLRVVHTENIQPVSTVTGTASSPTLVAFSLTVPLPAGQVALPVAVPASAAPAGR